MNWWSPPWPTGESRTLTSSEESPEVVSSHHINPRKGQRDAFQSEGALLSLEEETWWKSLYEVAGTADPASLSQNQARKENLLSGQAKLERIWTQKHQVQLRTVGTFLKVGSTLVLNCLPHSAPRSFMPLVRRQRILCWRIRQAVVRRPKAVRTQPASQAHYRQPTARGHPLLRSSHFKYACMWPCE